VSIPRLSASFLLVDKPQGWTSHDVVARVRKLAGVKKVGHAGTLDPMATGLIVLGLKRATRLLRFVQVAPKEYVASAVFGVATDSLDADGAVLERSPMDIDETAVAGVMERFTGSIAQVPPMVSARKVSGRRLYQLAREGIEVEREAREVEIYRLELIDFAPAPYPEVVFRTVCSSGTYVRSLADDMAQALGGRAHLSALRRISNGSLNVAAAATLAEVESAVATGTLPSLLLSPAAGLPDLPAVTVGEELADAVRHGIAFPLAAVGEVGEVAGPVRVMDASGDLLGVYRVDRGKAMPEVVIA
jgi:tRNA pseudouridine55 synthase